MASIKDDRGYNQGFKPSQTLNTRTERRCDYIINKMDLKKGTRILEIGCGTGKLSFLLAKKTGKYVLGIDICRPFIEEAKRNYSRGNLQYKILDFNHPENLIKTDIKFDYIVGNGILHHLYFRIDKVLRDVYSLLKDNGKIVFLEPNAFNPYCFLIFNFSPFRKLANLELGEMAFTKRLISEKLSDARYKNIEVEYKDFLFPSTPLFLVKPVIFIGRIMEKLPILNKLAQSIFISASKS